MLDFVVFEVALGVAFDVVFDVGLVEVDAFDVFAELADLIELVDLFDYFKVDHINWPLH